MIVGISMDQETCQDGQEDGVSKACPKQAAADSRGSRTCVCANTFYLWVWHTQGREGWINILPWYRLVGVAIPPVRRKGGRARLPKKGKWPPRGTGTTVLTYPRSALRYQARLVKNGQNSGEMDGSSPWTRPSAPECGDTLQALAGDQRPTLGWGSSSKTVWRSLSTGSPAGRTPPHGDGSMYSQANVMAGNVPTASYPSVAVHDRGH